MTSEIEALKTNEFLRRRKLRIQQVREQSKDIAKRIRERASAEKLRRLVDLDSEKGRIYLEQQDKLVKKLEYLCAKSLGNVGAGHKKAAEITEQGDKQEKTDISKQRGRVAAAELRKKKQEKLDERKKSLDRKLIAREIANEISRDKCSTTSIKLKASDFKTSEELVPSEPIQSNPQQTSTTQLNNEKDSIVTGEMATQWDEPLPTEWVPNIPALSLPKEDSPKAVTPKNVDSNSDKVKRTNLFALSEEMPSSLRGGLASVLEEPSTKPSFTQVSDYIHNRDLRLREHDTVTKKPNEELQRIKQTLVRTRAARAEVSAKGATNREKSSRPANTENSLSKKSSVTMYNHSTRDVKDVPFVDKKIVSRDLQSNDDAYSLAIKESSVETNNEEGGGRKDSQKKLHDLRNRIAVTKQNVEKEYKDTMAFLKSLPKDNSKPIKNAYRDGPQQQMHNECRQRKLQQEFRKIQKECKKHPHSSSRPSFNNSKSPVRVEPGDDDFNAKDFQYSWMPVPESDGNLAIHTIPTTVKQNKPGSAVRFSKIDSYHEYRSRHKHTPPTKDTSQKQKEIIIEEDSEESDSSSTSDTSSVVSMKLNKSIAKRAKKYCDDGKLSDAERIVIYKILDTKEKFRAKQNSKIIKDIAKSLSVMTKERLPSPNGREASEAGPSESKNLSKHAKTRLSFEQLKEGVYKTINEGGMAYNIMSCYTSNIEYWQSTDGIKPWWDNMVSACVHDRQPEQSGSKLTAVDHPRLQKFCVEAACGCDNADPKPSNAHRSSASTSTTSFQTASYDKATSLNMADVKVAEEATKPPDGMIKLVDEKGKESGKFYIGATGFLKDDDYEVIIQLRKKDATKADGNEMPNVVDEKTTTSGSNAPPSTPERSAEHSLQTGMTVTAPLEASSKATCGSQCLDAATTVPNSDQNKSEHILDSVEFEEILQPREQDKPKQTVDKGVYTSAQDSFVFPVNCPKASSVAKPANSVSTQTTVDSPVHRPLFIHMSSSTSTAYMSPPEFILPPFLKNNQKRNFASDDTSDLQDSGLKELEQECRDQYDDDAFVQYAHVKRNIISSPRVAPGQSPIKNRKMTKKFRAPPNTARSISSAYDEQMTHSCRRKIYSANSFPLKKCKKCEKHSQMKLYLNSLPRRSRINMPTLHKPRRTNSNGSQRMFNKSTKSRSTYGGQNMNPVIKWYIDKLLDMNREGLKLVQVVDQECSVITTPGSSIIDVPQNMKRSKTRTTPSISLQQIKDNLTSKILEEFKLKPPHGFVHYEKNIGDHGLEENNIFKKFLPRNPRKKSVHKVKSLNISKKLASTKSMERQKITTNTVSSTSPSETSSSRTDDCLKSMPTIPSRTKSRSKSSPSPRRVLNDDKLNRKNNSADFIKIVSSSELPVKPLKTDQVKAPIQKSQSVICSAADFEVPRPPPASPRVPMHISTQTSRIIDEEINYIKLAESKLQNMEKIADLTEKCTKRLSNLAKVLDEVRRNKSVAYSQVSDPASDTDRTSTKNSDTQLASTSTYEPVIEIRERTDANSPPRCTTTSPETEDTGKKCFETGTFSKNIPEPRKSKSPSPPSPQKPKRRTLSPNRTLKAQPGEHHIVKNRGKPPPALSRKCLKRAPEVVIPHELSTVIEVDSPLSTKFKNHPSRTENNTKYGESSNASEFKETKEETNNNYPDEQDNNPDLLQSNANLSRRQAKVPSMDSSDETKMQMMDMKRFNEIMLKPFISINEYAKQCNVTSVEEPSNTDNVTREDVLNEELSSLHSDGSLPDVIAELLKRNLIKEPFKFETASNPNSTTVSSESTLSVFALSKVKKDKKKSGQVFSNKENIAETSDSLSISSNPDLENAFKKMGMGWASSTLKKTKERLALSSSSNTSTSSLSQYKLKSINNHEFPALVTDSMSTSEILRADSIKNVEQQTSRINSMTVKQFLKNELAKKITFSKSHREDTQEDNFISLYETKMPDELKHSLNVVREERSVDSNARARTSTPVQLFKSLTYHSSSSSNISNGLFSNADDLSSVKGTSNSMRNHSTSDKDDLTIPNFSLRMRKGNSDCSKSD